MAENINALILPIGADATQFEKSIDEVRAAYRSLQKEIASKPFNLVTDKDRSDLANYKKTLDSLDASLNNVNFKNLSGGSKDARTALTSLSLVAQDLPFGFIAIQNNLPSVISSFGAISTASLGTAGTIAALKSALIGPAGLFLAFSVITAGITVAVQKYGSLGAAIDALFGKVDALADVKKRATDALKNFNKEYKTVGETIASSNSSVESQIIKLQALSDTVLNVNASENARKKALQELQSLDNERFKNFDIEKGKLEGLKNAVNEYTNAVLARAVAEKLADRTAEALSTREIQRNLYAESLKQLDQFKKRVPDIEKQVANFNKELLISRELQKGQAGAALPRASQDVSDYLALSVAAANYEKELIKLNDTYVDARKVAKDATIEALAFGGSLKKVGDGGAGDLDKSIDAYQKAIDRLNFDEQQRKLKENAEAFQKWLKVYADFNKSEVLKQFEVKPKLTYFQEIDKQFKNLGDYLKNFKTDIPNLPKLELEASVKLKLDAEEEARKIQEAINKGLNSIYGAGTAPENDPVKRIDELSKRIKQAKDNFESTIRNGLQQPFEDFFSTLIETGKFSLDSFEGLFKDMLKRIAAQIISAGIAKLISSILFPPGAASSALGGAALGNDATGGIIGTLISLFGGRRSAFNNVNFGGVNGGGMQMAGAVNLTLRGSDLVASINRTNTTINRIG